MPVFVTLLIDAESPTREPPVPQVGKPVAKVKVLPASGSVIVKLNVRVCPSFAVVGGLSKATVGGGVRGVVVDDRHGALGRVANVYA